MCRCSGRTEVLPLLKLLYWLPIENVSMFSRCTDIQNSYTRLISVNPPTTCNFSLDRHNLLTWLSVSTNAANSNSYWSWQACFDYFLWENPNCMELATCLTTIQWFPPNERQHWKRRVTCAKEICTGNLHENFDASLSQFPAQKRLAGQLHCTTHVMCWIFSVLE